MVFLQREKEDFLATEDTELIAMVFYKEKKRFDFTKRDRKNNLYKR